MVSRVARFSLDGRVDSSPSPIRGPPTSVPLRHVLILVPHLGRLVMGSLSTEMIVHILTSVLSRYRSLRCGCLLGLQSFYLFHEDAHLLVPLAQGFLKLSALSCQFFFHPHLRSLSREVGRVIPKCSGPICSLTRGLPVGFLLPLYRTCRLC